MDLDQTWEVYQKQPVDVLNILEEAEHTDTEIQHLDQCFEDLEYIRSQLKYVHFNNYLIYVK